MKPIFFAKEKETQLLLLFRNTNGSKNGVSIRFKTHLIGFISCDTLFARGSTTCKMSDFQQNKILGTSHIFRPQTRESTWFSNWIETLPKDLQARLDLWRFCCDCLDNVNGEYARMSFAVQDDYAHTDRAHEFFDADVARDLLELLRKAHSERRAVCRSPEKHALFSANPRERFRVALTCSHGFGSSSLSTLRAAESLVRVLSEHSDRCVCELFYDRDTMYLFLSAANPNSTDPALRSDFLPGALWTDPEVDFDAWVSGFCQDSPSGCFAAFELFFAKVRALPKDDWINRREACDMLFRALDGMESRDCWFFITLGVPLVRDRPPKSSSEM